MALINAPRGFLDFANKGEKGDKGDTGAAGATGATGAEGQKGDTGEQGIQGVQGIQGLQGIQGVQGETGAQGEAATVSVGTVTTGAAGSSAAVSNAGTTNAAVFNFTIPKGDTGAQGIKGDTGATGTTGATGAAGADGADGADGVGVPVGGTAGQVLAKIDGANYNTQWATPSATGGDFVKLLDITTVAAATQIDISLSGITVSEYAQLHAFIYCAAASAAGQPYMRLNGISTTGVYKQTISSVNNVTAPVSAAQVLLAGTDHLTTVGSAIDVSLNLVGSVITGHATGIHPAYRQNCDFRVDPATLSPGALSSINLISTSSIAAGAIIKLYGVKV